MSATKRYLENLYELAEEAIATELSETINAHFKGDEDEMYEWLNETIFTDLKAAYSVLFDCKTDLPWNYICLKTEKFLAEVEKNFPELREERLNDEYFFWSEGDTAELYHFAKEMVEFENDYDPYNGAFDSDEEAIASIMALLTESPETIVETFQERIGYEEDEENPDVDMVKTMKRFIRRAKRRDWKYDGSILIAGSITDYRVHLERLNRRAD